MSKKLMMKTRLKETYDENTVPLEEAKCTKDEANLIASSEERSVQFNADPSLHVDRGAVYGPAF